MMTLRPITLLAASVLISSLAAAEDRACTIEGTLTVMGQSEYSKDCIELDAGADIAILKRACDGLAEAGKHFGGEAGKLTYSATCPLPAQGSCGPLMKQPLTAYYYARAEKDLPTVAQSCQMMGGTWKAGK